MRCIVINTGECLRLLVSNKKEASVCVSTRSDYSLPFFIMVIGVP